MTILLITKGIAAAQASADHETTLRLEQALATLRTSRKETLEPTQNSPETPPKRDQNDASEPKTPETARLEKLPIGSPLPEPPATISAYDNYARTIGENTPKAMIVCFAPRVADSLLFVLFRFVGSDLKAPVLVLKTKYGLGNRILSLVSGFVLAFLTNRRHRPKPSPNYGLGLFISGTPCPDSEISTP